MNELSPKIKPLIEKLSFRSKNEAVNRMGFRSKTESVNQSPVQKN